MARPSSCVQQTVDIECKTIPPKIKLSKNTPQETFERNAVRRMWRSLVFHSKKLTDSLCVCGCWRGESAEAVTVKCF